MCGQSISLRNYQKHLTKDCSVAQAAKVAYPNFDMKPSEQEQSLQAKDYLKLYVLRMNLIKKGLESETCYEDKKTAKYNLSLNDLTKDGE